MTSIQRQPMIQCHGLVRVYTRPGRRGVDPIEVVALQGLELTVAPGEFVAVVGASGSGKSTLLRILAGLDTPTAGQIRVAGQDVTRMGPRQRLRYRRTVVGCVWQHTHDNLLPHLSASENIELGMLFAGHHRAARRRRTDELLGLLGLAAQRDHRPAQLSGGQQQRVSIAAALAADPALLLADEPTGALDSHTAGEVLKAFETVNADLGVTILVVTHDELVAGRVQRTVGIRDGRTSSEVYRRDGSVTEFAVLDRAGRLQLPVDVTTALGLTDRVRVDLRADHVRLYPDTGPTTADRPDPGE